MAPTPAAKAVASERKRQGGTIVDPEPIKAWAQQQVEKRAAPKPVEDDRSAHDRRVQEEAHRFQTDLAALIDHYRDIDTLLARRPLKSVVGPTEHHSYSTIIRDIALRTSRELESVSGSESVGRQISLVAINGGKA